MNLTWITFGPLEQVNHILTSPVASARYRMIIPALELAKQHHIINLLSVTHSSRLQDFFPYLGGDAVIFSKSFNSLNEELAKRAKQAGAKVYFDICDNHFEHPHYASHYQAMVSLADVMIANTPEMADLVTQYTGKAATVISDPYEGTRGEPRFSRSATGLHLLWFGHPTNLDSLQILIPQLLPLSNQIPLELHIVTAPHREFEQRCVLFNQQYGAHFHLRFSPWSLETTWQALRDTDIVLLPSIANDRKRVKSPNRLIESFWAGRFVVAHPLPAYQTYGQWGWINENVVTGIQWALQHPDQVLQKIAEAQRHIAEHCSPETIAKQWEKVLSTFRPHPRPLSQGERGGVVRGFLPSPPGRGAGGEGAGGEGGSLRLNLGCGDKLLPGYINVDVAPSRLGVRPDVLCDLHQLTPFADNFADEILAVHVIEHFWRWEVVDLLKEWLRVLKPGGTLILECPNLLTACQEFLKNPDVATGPGVEGQRTMWVFYGDPAWQDPLMVHRWGYTPQSLAKIMAEAGCVEICQEPAQFKLREPRDMRVVGRKQ